MRLQIYYNSTNRQTKDAGRQIGAYKARLFLDCYGWQRGAVEAASRDDLLQRYKEFLRDKRSEETSLDRLEKRPCALAGEGLGRLSALLDNKKLAEVLASATPAGRKGKMLEFGQINIAIAAIDEAIDQRQAKHQGGDCKDPFRGGFALAASTPMQAASSNYDDGGVVLGQGDVVS